MFARIKLDDGGTTLLKLANVVEILPDDTGCLIYTLLVARHSPMFADEVETALRDAETEWITHCLDIKYSRESGR